MGEQDTQFVSIQRALWHKAQFKSLSDDAKLLFLYINTCQHGNMLGFYVLPIGYGCEDLKWERKRFIEGLHELLNKRLIEYDFDADVVLDLHHILKFPPQNPNQVKAAIKKFNDLPFTPLFQQFISMLERLPEPFIKPLYEHIVKRYTESVSESVSETETETVPVNPGETPPKETVITPTMAEAIPLAQLLFDQIQTIDPKFTATGRRLSRWAEDIEKLIRIDARSPEEIRRLIMWVHSNPAYFWCGKIQSGEKLRERFSQIWVDMNKPGNKKAVGQFDSNAFMEAQKDGGRS